MEARGLGKSEENIRVAAETIEHLMRLISKTGIMRDKEGEAKR